jgi:tetratricopeptide (TPR) repeat protein
MNAWEAIEAKYEEADAAIGKYDLQLAERLLREIVDSEPSEPLFRWRLGYVLSDLHEYANAIHEFNEVLKLDPKNVPAWGGLGQVHTELGEWKEAEFAFRKRLEFKKSPQHFVFLANNMIQMSRFDEAIDACNKALELSPAFDEAYLNLGLAQRHLRHTDQAIEAFKKAIELDTGYALAYRELGATYFLRSEFLSAQAALKKCLNYDPRDAWAHLYLAFCLQHLNDDTNAAMHFAEAVKEAPDVAFFREKQQEFESRRQPMAG